MTIKDNIILKTKLYIFSHVKLAKLDIYIDKLSRSILITYGLRVRAALRNIKPTSQDRGYNRYFPLLGKRSRSVSLFTRWGTCAQASIGFGMHWQSPIDDSHKIEY